MAENNNLPILKFYNDVIDDFLAFAVIIARYKNKWILCKHKKRSTYEIPGGKREKVEAILDTAKRELYEETGAVEFDITPFTSYSVIKGNIESFGMIYYADVYKIDSMPESEMETFILFDSLPEIENWTYPTLQPLMIDRYNYLKSV